MEKTSKLSDKELRFCHEYIKDGNGTRSAIAAGYTGQKLSMAVIASRLLIKANIVSKIEALRVMHATKIQISAEKILQELAKSHSLIYKITTSLAMSCATSLL